MNNHRKKDVPNEEYYRIFLKHSNCVVGQPCKAGVPGQHAGVPSPVRKQVNNKPANKTGL